MEIQELIKCCIMRGGTSRAVFFLRNDLPKDDMLRDKIILRVIGAPDLREIDGLGGADLLTSKVAIIGPPTRRDCDVDYLFGQVSLTEPLVDYSANCGNISSAVGPFAIDEGLLNPVEPVTTVRINQLNTKVVLVAEVPVTGNKARIDGTYKIDGVPGSGARINMDFSGTSGAITGRLLPTGSATDLLHVEGESDMEVSLVDAATTGVFVRAEDMGLTGTESPQDLLQNAKLLDKIEKIRSFAAAKLGFVKDWRRASIESQMQPYFVICGHHQSYKSCTTGEKIDESSIDLCARHLSMRLVNRAFGGTVTICTIAAAMIPGTVVNQVARRGIVEKGELRIGHPSGIITAEGMIDKQDGSFLLRKAVFGRTARCIMKGYAFIPKEISRAG